MVIARTAQNAEVARIWELLRGIPDPEIPVVSLVDLNIITDVALDGNQVRVTLRPTFSGCPALQHMRSEVERVLAQSGFTPQVTIDHTKAWTTDALAEDVKERLKSVGIAPPPPRGESLAASLELPVPCPHCGATTTTLESSFGSTLCRQIFYCDSCRQSFDRFKPL